MKGFQRGLRAFMVLVGMFFGPRMLFTVVVNGGEAVKGDRLEQLAIFLPAAIALISWALWGLVDGHLYTKGRGFPLVASMCHLWGGFNIVAFQEPLSFKALAVLWFIWSFRFFSLGIRRARAAEA